MSPREKQANTVYGYTRARRVFDYLCRTYRRWNDAGYTWTDEGAADAAWLLHKTWGFRNGLSFL